MKQRMTSQCLAAALVFGVLSMTTAVAAISGFLEGTWVVQCADGHRDTVGGITRNHNCEKCGKKSVSEGGALVVCPDGHVSGVGAITRNHKCPTCGKECRRD